MPNKALADISCWQRDSDNESSFLPIDDAVRLITGQSEHEPLNIGNPGGSLWLNALSSKGSWNVRTCILNKPESKTPTGIITYVHMGDFVKWAQLNQDARPDNVKLWTPEVLADKSMSWAKKTKSPECSREDEDAFERRIQWAEGLLRRYAEVGLEPQQQGAAQASHGDDYLADAELGKKYRQRMAAMGNRRQAEAETKRGWWAPYIKEGRELVNKGKAKSDAARAVARRHPEAGINWNTLRQML